MECTKKADKNATGFRKLQMAQGLFFHSIHSIDKPKNRKDIDQ
jgi:hypothetical protein